jgi:hypothetical protein
MNGLYRVHQQFQEIAERIPLPAEALEQYHKFATEYNSFVEQFRDSIGELKKLAGTEIEPPSVKAAQEVLSAPKAVKSDKAEKDIKRGYIT